jgi:alginate lyase
MFLKSSLSIVAFTICFQCVFAADTNQTALPKVFCADPRALADAKIKFVANDPSLKPAFDRLLADANRALAAKLRSVMEKNRIPPSGDKHDYVSQAPYFWADTNSPGKYIRRDGERNPESDRDSDAGRLSSTCSDVTALGLAYYFTDDEKYAAKAAQLLRVFFLDPATKMNPNLNFGQGIPGEVDGRPAGLISARGFVDMMDGLGLLENSKSWPAADQQEMRAWLEQYLKWLTTSKIGTGELNAKNNHGSFCTDQAVTMALFLGKTDYARKIVSDATNRIAWQITPDGREPLELARTKSFGYSSFNLRALVDLASIGQNLGIDLWHFRGTNSAGIYNALAFMAPYADPKKTWPFQQIHGYNHAPLADLLLRAAPQFPQSHLSDDLQFFQPDELVSNRCRLLFKTAEIKTAATATLKNGKNAQGEKLEE